MNFQYILKNYSKTGIIVSTIVLFSICAHMSIYAPIHDTEKKTSNT